MKFYTDGHSEIAFNADHWVDMAYDRKSSVIVELQKPEAGGEAKWCLELGAFIDTSDECGKQCVNYDPRNGTSGCCRNIRQGFIGTGQFYEITPTGKVIKCNSAKK